MLLRYSNIFNPEGFRLEEVKNQNFIKRASFAWAGLKYTWGNEKSFRTQVCLGLGAIATLVGLGASPSWLAIFLVCIGSVLSLELFNSALESWIDELQPDFKLGLKHAKDCAAGAVLISSIISVLVYLCFIYTKVVGVILHE